MNEMGRPALRPSYCTRCGAEVGPYDPSALSLRAAFEWGQSPPEDALMGQPHYWCGRCGEHWLATNLMDTGTTCEGCGGLVPLRDRYCALCGRPRA